MISKERMLDHITNHFDDPSQIFQWIQHRPHQLSFLRKFCDVEGFGGFVISNNKEYSFLHSDQNQTHYYESICGIASYFCTSDIRNNFTIRRQPTYYFEAVDNCKKDNSSLISSKSASDIALAKEGFKKNSFSQNDHFEISESYNLICKHFSLG